MKTESHWLKGLGTSLLHSWFPPHWY